VQIQMPANQKKLLLIDSNPSRYSKKVLENFRNNNAIVLTFPSHLTHIIRPFDVRLASRLKVATKKILRRIKILFKN
jgi:hypothetical protein